MIYRLILIGTACCAVAGMARPADGDPAPENAERREAAVDNKPDDIRFLPGTLDAGRVREGMTRRVSLTIERPPDVPLRLGRTWTSCSCVTIVPSRRRFAAGEDAELEVDIATLGRTGKNEFIVTTEVLEPRRTRIEAALTIDVERVPAQLWLEPAELRLGAVTGPRTLTVTLYNLTKQPLIIDEPTVSRAGLAATLPEGGTAEPGSALPFSVTIDPARWPAGPLAEHIALRTSLPLHRTVEIPITGVVPVTDKRADG